MEFRLRDWTFEDQESLLKFGNNFQVARFMTDQFPHPYTPERARAFIEFAMAQNPKRIFCIEVNGEAAGGIGLHFHPQRGRANGSTRATCKYLDKTRAGR